MSDGSIEQPETEAARQAAQEAVGQARETTEQAIEAIKAMDAPRIGYLACLGTVALFTLIFNMASYSVGLDVAVSETTAQAQRVAEAKLNAAALSAFTATTWGKLAWLSAVAGIGLVIWSAVTKSRLAWVPLAQVGLAGLATLVMMLLFFVGFPDLSAYDDASCSATLLGYWVPLFAAGGATFLAAKPLFFDK